MARYSTINEQFRPMSYQEMLAPVQMADTEHKNLEQSQADLAAASIQWEDKLKNETDPTLRNLYQGYVDNLRKQAETLASKGLDGTSRRGLLDLRTQYARDIIPIEEAYKKYQAELARRQQLRDADASTIFEKGDLNITNYYNNPETQYKAMKVDDVYKTAAADFGNYATKFLEKNIGKWKNTAFGQMLERRMHSGATEGQILDLIANSPNAPEELKELYETIKTQYFERGNWSEEDQNKIVDALNRGAIYGIGSIKSDLQKNENFVPYHLRAGTTETPTNPVIRNVYSLQSRNLEGQEGKDFIDTFNSYYKDKKGNFKNTLSVGTVVGNTLIIDEITIFDKNGKVLTKEEFLKQQIERGMGKYKRSMPIHDKKQAEKSYDLFYQYVKDLGLDVNEGVTKKDIENALNGIETFSTNTMNVIEFVPEDNNVNGVLSSLLTKFQHNIKRVSSWDKHGNITLDPKKVEVEKVFEKQSNTTDYKQKPNFFIPPNKNTKGIFIRYNGENYYIANNSLGDTGKKAQEKINQAAEKNEELKKLLAKQTKTQEDINNISKLEQILANIDSQIIAIYNVALQLSYDENKVKTYNPNAK